MKIGWLKREDEQESVSLTLLVFVVIIITAKLCVSGMAINGYKFSDFDAMDWSTIFTPVAGLYFGQKIQHYRRKKKPPAPLETDGPPDTI